MNAYEKYDKGQGSEHELINRRLTWQLTSQTLLFAALAIAYGKEDLINKNLLCILSTVGILISILVWIAITASLLAKYLIWQDYKKESGDTKQSWGVRTWITIMAAFAEFCIPWIFIWAWWTMAFAQ